MTDMARLAEKLDDLKDDIADLKLQMLPQLDHLGLEQKKHWEMINLLQALQEKDRELLSARMAKVERPLEWVAITTKIIFWSGAIASAAYTILKLLGEA